MSQGNVIKGDNVNRDYSIQLGLNGSSNNENKPEIPGKNVYTREEYEKLQQAEIDKTAAQTKAPASSTPSVGSSGTTAGNVGTSGSQKVEGGAVITKSEQIDLTAFNESHKLDAKQLSNGKPVVSDDGIIYQATQKIPDDSIDETKLKDADDKSSLVFFPYYRISDYTRDIHNWRKQINPYGTKGCFYFKIFFNFDTNYGLIGGSTTNRTSVNTARKYLSNIKGLPIYESENLNDRYIALIRFIDSLKNISVHTPWFFKEISNLDSIIDVPIDGEDFGEHFVNIVCSEESVDMRLGTLFDLYKFACYNTIRNKEIIPANLRKFEMSILFMHVPLKKYHTKWQEVNDELSLNTLYHDDKELDFNKATDSSSIMSVKMLTFQNCEFDITSMTDLPNEVNNEMSFDLGKSILKIKYDRLYVHRLNEFEDIGFGQDGLIYPTDNFYDLNELRLDEIAQDLHKRINSHKTKLYEANIEENIYASPQNIDSVLSRRQDMFNKKKRTNTTYLNKKLDNLKGPTFNGDNIYGNFTQVRSQYYLTKLKRAKEGTIRNGNIYGYDLGRVGIGTQRVNTKYLDKKLDYIKNGSRGRIIPITDGNPNSFTLDWGANALNYNNYSLSVEGNPSTKHTFFGKLAETTWQRTKSAFGY